MITSIGFSGGWRPGQLAIQGITFDLFAHCFVLFSDGFIIDATAKGGVKRRKLENVGASWRHFIPASFLTLSQNSQLEYWLREQIGKPYDTSFLRAPFGRDWQQDDRWWCSELIGAGLVEVGALNIPKMNRLSPRNLRRRIEK